MSLADGAIRDRALDISGSFAVSAPAGSGKTGLLVRRILRLLVTCKQPEEVLAITFTRKAAAEMQERIIAALASARNDTPPADSYQAAIWQDARRALARDTEQGWQLLASPSRLRIMTIDSLCRYLARQLAVETGLGELPEPTEQPEFFYREAIHQLLSELEKPGKLADSLALLLRHLDNNPATLERLLENLLARREQWLEPLMASRDARQRLEATLQSTLLETFENVRQQMLAIGGELSMLADYAAANLTAENPDHSIGVLTGISELPPVSTDDHTLQQWLAIGDMLLNKEGDWRKPKGITKRNGFPTKKDSIDPENAELRKQQLVEIIQCCMEQPGLQALLTDVRHLPPPEFTDSQWQLLEALTTVLPRLVAELSLLFKSRHSCDFTEMTLAALKALGTEEAPSDLSLRLDYKIQHILVDEFQDTSSIQFNLLKKLTWGWQPDDGRTLFIVGDGMQSLYGFRNANVGIFLEARKLPLGNIALEPLNLEVNFRSDSTIVDWVNRTFTHVFPSREDISRGAVSYSKALAANSGISQAEVTLDLFEEHSDATDEAEQVVQRIKAARAQDPQGTIAVLAYRRNHLRSIFKALMDHQIPWEATDIDPLGTRMVVTDLFSLTRALLNPADRIAWLSVLRSPCCGFTLNDLHTITHYGEERNSVGKDLPWIGGQLWTKNLEQALSDDGRARLKRISPILNAAWENRYRKPLRQWIEGTWLAMGGPAALVDPAQLGWCLQYFDLLEKHDQGGSIEDMARFEAAVDRLYAKPASNSDNPVQVMTIHKSKGLEFDTVILPGLHRGMATNNSALLYWRERINRHGDAELIISPPLSQDSDDNSSDQLVRHLKHEDKQRSNLEDSRVLYVACTRAIKRLHLLFNKPNKSPAAGSLLASLWPAFQETENYHGARCNMHTPVTPAEPQQADSTRITEILRLPADWKHPVSPAVTVHISSQSGMTLSQDKDPTARHTGTVLHRTLAQIVLEGVNLWNETRIAKQQAAWHIQLRQLGILDTAPQITALTRGITTMLADPEGRWLLDDSHRESACELAVSHCHGQEIAQLVIDRTFIDDNLRWIVDYKSSVPLEGEDLSLFIAREEAQYREQLTTYRQAMALIDQREIRTALYFPLIPLLHTISGD